MNQNQGNLLARAIEFISDNGRINFEKGTADYYAEVEGELDFALTEEFGIDADEAALIVSEYIRHNA